MLSIKPGYYNLVRSLRNPITPELGTLSAPTFDHAVKDPVEGGVEIGRDVKIVVFEGNYVCSPPLPFRSLQIDPAKPGRSRPSVGKRF